MAWSFVFPSNSKEAILNTLVIQKYKIEEENQVKKGNFWQITKLLSPQGTPTFIKEVGIIGQIHHKFLSPVEAKRGFLSWEKLKDIASGVAKRTVYLHLGCN
ncbi:hypothetical protein PanWU01x14_069580 [Parasponia andersonii]|uniref:Uncharacterized protein n=1 Tax=Parasponia andersonii TaxID=3476 RepID=A0A2P5DFR1_PARAD|nr:hypothetical protein PanWU01x14_069580 [Parasponia andersonii]